MKQEIRDCALNYLTAKDRTCEEMRVHLIGKEYEPDEISEEIEFLKDFNYINDRAYCERFLERAIKKNHGISGIEAELKGKGIGQEIVEEALCAMGIEDRQAFEKERAAAAADRYMAGREISKKTLAGTARKLSSLGYDSEIVYHVIGKFMDGKNGEE